MSNIIRNETAHSIHGVPGRLLSLRRPPAPWKAGTFANQTWVSQSRPIKGYGAGARLTVNMRFDDNCKNGHNSFAITGDIRSSRGEEAGGCVHDEITEVFPELVHLIRWHLCSTDGPMHYVANTVYHARQHGANRAWVYFTGSSDPMNIGETKERCVGYVKADEARKVEAVDGYRVQWDEKTVKVQNLDYARSCAVWPEATDEQLCLPSGELTALLEARLPALLAAMRADIEAAGFVWLCPAE